MKGNWKAYFALGTICILWGTTYLGLRIGVQSFPPFLLSGIRQTLAGVAIISFFLLKGEKLPRWSAFKYQALAGLLMVFLGNGVVAWGEKYVPSGIAAVICSLMPIWVILINSFTGHEKTTVLTAVGVLVGFLGIAGIFSENLSDFANPDYTLGIVIIFFASFCWAVGTLINKRKNGNANPIFSAGLQMFSGGFVMLGVSPVLDSYENFNPKPEAWWALLYLTVFGSIVAYSAYAYALNKLPAATVSMYAYVNPIVALLLGYLVLDEKLNPLIGLFSVLTLAGIYLVKKGTKLQTYDDSIPSRNLWSRIRQIVR